MIDTVHTYINTPESKGRHKRESKNAKQMRNTKQNCFSHSSASLRNDKQCSAKQCFANQTNKCLAGFASRSDLFWCCVVVAIYATAITCLATPQLQGTRVHDLWCMRYLYVMCVHVSVCEF